MSFCHNPHITLNNSRAVRLSFARLLVAPSKTNRQFLFKSIFLVLLSVFSPCASLMSFQIKEAQFFLSQTLNIGFSNRPASFPWRAIMTSCCRHGAQGVVFCLLASLRKCFYIFWGNQKLTVNFHYKSISIPSRKITSLKFRTMSREDLFIFFDKTVIDQNGLLLKGTFVSSAKCAARVTKSSVH